MRPWLWLGTVFVMLAAPGVAQEQMMVLAASGHQLCTLRANVFAGSPRGVGVGFLRVEVENVDAVPHAVEVELSTLKLGDSDVLVRQRFPLAAQERAVAFLPLPAPMTSLRLRFFGEGQEQVVVIGPVQGQGLVGVLLSDRTDTLPAGLLRVQALRSWSAKPPVLLPCTPNEAPTDWRLYAGFDFVLVDGRARLSSDLQEALRRAAFAGSTMVIAGAESMSPGSLRLAAMASSRDGRIAHGLGVLCTIPSLDAEPLSARPILAGLGELGDGPLPLPLVLASEQTIPGLGDAPVTAFLLVIVLFALVAGPINFILLWRWRRPMLALVTVPALGFGTTAVILVYGFLHDGFVVRGVVTSWTLLDQGRHEAVTIAARTLFAGRAPGTLSMGADSLVLSPRSTQRPEGAADRWHYDAEHQRLDGGVLPSRTATPLCSLQQGVIRERLTVQRQAGSLRVLTDGGMQPIGPMVLRDLEGAYWLGEANGLRQVSDGEAGNAIASMEAIVDVLEVEVEVERHPWQRHQPPTREAKRVQVGDLVERMFARDAMPKGSFLAQVTKAPWLDTHGLDVHYDAERHFVHGRLQAEDFVQ